MEIVSFKIADPWYDHIRSGEKIYEGRRITEKVKFLRPDMTVEFSHISDDSKEPLYLRVVRIIPFETFEDALRTLGLYQTLPGVETLEEGIEIYNAYIPIERQKEEGVVMIELSSC